MFYTIYKITNKLDGKFYIGKHQTLDLNDNYMGSGKLLKRAIKKHGIENFTKEILHVFDNEDEMNVKEKELVLLNENSYNLCPGGQGGWGYVNKKIWTDEKRLQHNREHSGFKKLTTEQNKEYGSLGGQSRAKMIKALTPEQKVEMFAHNAFRGKSHTEETKKRIGKSNSNRVPWNKGRPRTKAEKQKIRDGVLRTLEK